MRLRHAVVIRYGGTGQHPGRVDVFRRGYDTEINRNAGGRPSVGAHQTDGKRIRQKAVDPSLLLAAGELRADADADQNGTVLKTGGDHANVIVADLPPRRNPD